MPTPLIPKRVLEETDEHTSLPQKTVDDSIYTVIRTLEHDSRPCLRSSEFQTGYQSRRTSSQSMEEKSRSMCEIERNEAQEIGSPTQSLTRLQAYLSNLDNANKID